MLTAKPSRAERVVEAQRLRAEGLSLREIREQMGVSLSSVDSYLNDSDLAKQRARRRGYARPCPECGKPMDGSAGKVGRARPRACRDCSPRLCRKWTEEEIVRAIRDFAALAGRPPHVADFNAAMARRRGHEDRALLYEAHEEWPASVNVIACFGNWNAAIHAAGFEPTPSGYYDVEDYVAATQGPA